MKPSLGDAAGLDGVIQASTEPDHLIESVVQRGLPT
jgi:hypothetical protein